jgi:acyl-coenzyme A synthetase/AMP-(fatty) acid ligase/acyl carrier protein
MIYTSGSTGRPKGVLLPHRGLPNLRAAQAHLFNPGPADRVLQFSSLSFDASVFEIVMALASGATLCFARRDVLIAGPELVRFMRDSGITNVTLPPSALAVTPADELPELRTMVLAGEALTADLVERWARGRDFFNAYGPTEATIWSSVSRCVNGQDKPAIGRPIFNTRIYLLDEHLKPVPVGVTGKLFISGIGLARGYLNLPDTTAEKFIPDPFSVEPGRRMYNSGDLARYLPDGNVMFVGRADDQVKVRGFRIETGEIEATLKEFNEVSDAVVVVRQSASGDQTLAAYVVPAGASAIDAGDLREKLKKRLPSYMIPIFVVLESLPLTPSGKVDRKALPAPEDFAQSAADKYVAPRTPLEEVLARIWGEVLGVERVGVNDDFFQLGGHSLLATQIISQVREALHTEVQLRTLFDSPTVGGLAAAIAQSQVEASDREMELMLTELESLSEDDVRTLLEIESTQGEKS